MLIESTRARRRERI